MGAQTVVPFTADHLDAAAALLAARHRADRARAPELPARFEQADEAHALLQSLLDEGSSGEAAVRDGRLEGYLLGAAELVHPASGTAQFVRPRTARIENAGHAVDPATAEATYRRLYTALAARWLAAALFVHDVDVPAADRDAVAAWFGLGFGQSFVQAARDTGPLAVGDEAPGLEIRPAAAADHATILALADGLHRSFAASPTYRPYLPELVPDVHAHQAELLADPHVTHWVAARAGRVVGFQSVIAPASAAWFLAPLAAPERGVYLFQAFVVPEARGTGVGTALLARALGWAREAGYEHCSLHYLAASPAAGFWRGHDFRPLVCTLSRHVDERIAWVRARQ
jgi:GNAT superfamily N-acetyltransferase